MEKNIYLPRRNAFQITLTQSMSLRTTKSEKTMTEPKTPQPPSSGYEFSSAYPPPAESKDVRIDVRSSQSRRDLRRSGSQDKVSSHTTFR